MSWQFINLLDCSTILKLMFSALQLSCLYIITAVVYTSYTAGSACWQAWVVSLSCMSASITALNQGALDD